MLKREYYRWLLNKEKERLISRINSIEKNGLSMSQGDSVQELSAYDNHPGDLGSETFERGKDIGLRDNSRLLLTKVENALLRIEDGSYGYCENCGKEIPQERLQVLPDATLCVLCREAEGSKEGHSSPHPLEEKNLNIPLAVIFPTLENKMSLTGKTAGRQ